MLFPFQIKFAFVYSKLDFGANVLKLKNFSDHGGNVGEHSVGGIELTDIFDILRQNGSKVGELSVPQKYTTEYIGPSGNAYVIYNDYAGGASNYVRTKVEVYKKTQINTSKNQTQNQLNSAIKPPAYQKQAPSETGNMSNQQPQPIAAVSFLDSIVNFFKSLFGLS